MVPTGGPILVTGALGHVESGLGEVDGSNGDRISGL